MFFAERKICRFRVQCPGDETFLMNGSNRIRKKRGRCSLTMHTALVAIRIVHACLPPDLLFARCMIGATTSPRVSGEIYDGASRTTRALF